MRLSQGLIALPPGGEIVDFVRHDGSVPEPESVAAPGKPTLGSLRGRYMETHGKDTLEAHTLRGIRRHFKHMARELGESFPIRDLSLADQQGYVDRRARARGRRGPLNPATIRKEIVTLRTAWNWAVRMKIVAGRYPYDGLRYPKGEEKPPLQTGIEIERHRPGLPASKAAELWESLYLTLPEIGRLLDHVKAAALHPWIHPLVATAAHTGARKGELLKSMRPVNLSITHKSQSLFKSRLMYLIGKSYQAIQSHEMAHFCGNLIGITNCPISRATCG